jgi:hypothetical protein
VKKFERPWLKGVPKTPSEELAEAEKKHANEGIKTGSNSKEDPWTVELMVDLYRQSQWTQFFAYDKADGEFFLGLVKEGLGSMRPGPGGLAIFKMGETWVNELSEKYPPIHRARVMAEAAEREAEIDAQAAREALDGAAEGPSSEPAEEPADEEDDDRIGDVEVPDGSESDDD